MNRDRLLLQHILECIGWVESHLRGLDRDAFLQDRKTQSAVIRELQTLAESCQRLSPEAKDLRPDILWQGIAGFRNILVHDYFGISLQRVWNVVETDLPALKEAVQGIRDSLPDDNG